jgi:hypothetical protein
MDPVGTLAITRETSASDTESCLYSVVFVPNENGDQPPVYLCEGDQALSKVVEVLLPVAELREHILEGVRSEGHARAPDLTIPRAQLEEYGLAA